MLFLASLIATVEWVGGVCYTEEPDSTSQAIIFAPMSFSRESCKQTGLTVSNCESVYYSASKNKCYLFEKAGNATCGATFTRDKKLTTGCPRELPTTNYVADWCFDSPGVIAPNDLQIEAAPICPNKPMDGEATARVYVVSVMLDTGESIVLDNNAQAFLTWDATNTTWVYKSQNGRDVYANKPIYAASCAYFPAGTTGTNCGCKDLPFEYSTRGETGAMAPTGDDSGACPSGYSGIFIQAHTNQQYTCSPPCDFKMQCVGGVWIHVVQIGRDLDSFAVSNGTCYVRTASAK